MTKTFSQTDEKIQKYVERTFQPEDSILEEIRLRSKNEGLPEIQLSPMDALHLEVITRAAKAKKVVEIGTLGGYSGVCIARTLPKEGKLFTFEYNPHHAKVAQESFEKTNLSDKVEIFIGPALQNLLKIESSAPFDLVFIDADKISYPDYFRWAEKHLSIGGVLLADNTFAFGMIADSREEIEEKRVEDVEALQQFNTLVASSPNFRSTILPTGEGLTFGVKIK